MKRVTFLVRLEVLKISLRSILSLLTSFPGSFRDAQIRPHSTFRQSSLAEDLLFFAGMQHRIIIYPDKTGLSTTPLSYIMMEYVADYYNNKEGV